jgi:major type 1 subunit fimbrin (pilin)
VKKTLTLSSCAAALALAGLFGATAHAADGTITFTGSVGTSTCKVTAPAVTMPKSDTASLDADGKIASATAVKIFITGCGAVNTDVMKANFSGANVDFSTGRIRVPEVDSGATGLHLQLRNADNSIIKIGDDSTIKGTALVAGAGTLEYAVNYYANGGPVGAGAVSTTVDYSLVYP